MYTLVHSNDLLGVYSKGAGSILKVVRLKLLAHKAHHKLKTFMSSIKCYAYVHIKYAVANTTYIGHALR